MATFSLIMLMNVLVLEVPLIDAMYEKWSEELVVHLSLVQAIAWLTVLLFILEMRKAWSGMVEGGGIGWSEGRRRKRTGV